MCFGLKSQKEFFKKLLLEGKFVKKQVFVSQGVSKQKLSFKCLKNVNQMSSILKVLTMMFVI